VSPIPSFHQHGMLKSIEKRLKMSRSGKISSEREVSQASQGCFTKTQYERAS
jgi:hypothetical protein